MFLAVIGPEEHAVDILLVCHVADLDQVVGGRGKGFLVVAKGADLAHDHGCFFANSSHLGSEEMGRAQIATELFGNLLRVWRHVEEVDVAMQSIIMKDLSAELPEMAA